jgi:hypothetical protein
MGNTAEPVIHAPGGRPTAIAAAALVLLGAVCAPPPAGASKKAAAKQLAEADELFDDEEYEEALFAYKVAYQLDEDPDILLKIAECHLEMLDLVEARKYLGRYDKEKGGDLTEAQQKKLDKKIARIEKQIGILVVEAEEMEGELLVDGEAVGELPLDDPIYVSPGAHEVQVEQDGDVVFEREIVVNGGEKAVVEPEVEEEEEEEDEEEPEETPAKTGDGTMEVVVEGDVDARILLDGKTVGESGWSEELSPGAYEVAVEAEGLPSWKGKVEVREGRTTTVTVDLKGTALKPATSPLFWGSLGAAVPLLVTGVVLGVMTGMKSSESQDLLNELNAMDRAGIPDTDPEKARLIQKQNDTYKYGLELRNGTIVTLVLGGAMAALTVASLFIFRKEKPVATGAFEVSHVSPMLVPGTGVLGMSLGATF